MHYYPGYRLPDVLAMPALAFWSLYGVIARLDAQTSLRALMVATFAAHPGPRAQALVQYQQRLEQQAGYAPAAAASTMLPHAPGLVENAAPGSIEAERERQRAASERDEAARRAAWEAGRRG